VFTSRDDRGGRGRRPATRRAPAGTQVARAIPLLLVTAAVAGHAQEIVFRHGFEILDADESGSYTIMIGTVTDPCAQRPFTGDPPSVLTITRLSPGAYRITGTRA
jgi:hypothetical protein